jgi:hypothetical protein
MQPILNNHARLFNDPVFDDSYRSVPLKKEVLSMGKVGNNEWKFWSNLVRDLVGYYFNFFLLFISRSFSFPMMLHIRSINRVNTFQILSKRIAMESNR